MENDTRDILVPARLVDLHRRKAEAEKKDYSTKTHIETLIEVYQLEVAEIDEARRKPIQDSSRAA
jgi:hypothetical protein